MFSNRRTHTKAQRWRHFAHKGEWRDETKSGFLVILHKGEQVNVSITLFLISNDNCDYSVPSGDLLINKN